MKINIPTKYLFLGILIVFLTTFGIGWYISRQKADRASNTVINALAGKLKVYEYKIDSLSKVAYEKEQLIISQKQAIETGLIKQAELKALNIKKVSEVTMLKATVRLLLDSIKPDHPVVIIPCDTIIDTQPILYLPVEFTAPPNKYYDLKVSINETADMSVDLRMPVAIDLFTGYNNKTKSYIATLTSDNPHFEVSEIKSIKVEAKKPSRIGIGLHVGYGVTKEISLSPYIGIGVSYNLFTF